MKMQVDISKIKPAGAIAIAAISAVAIFMSFTANLGVPDRYVPRHDTAYYTQNADTMTELFAEVHANVLPRLSGVTDCYISSDGTQIVVVADSEEAEKILAVLRRDFGPELFAVLVSSGTE